jgi:hypothetical protein
VQDVIVRAVNEDGLAGRNISALRDELERLLSTYIYNQIRRRPMVFVILTTGAIEAEQGTEPALSEAKGSGEPQPPTP